MELHIDEEFQKLLPPLSDMEREMLEESIKKYGLLNPIMVWNGIIIDGHNRYVICKMNGITEIPVREMDFKNRDEAKAWIIIYQLGRRNIPDFEKARIALENSDCIAEKYRMRKLEGGNAGRESRWNNDGFGQIRPKPTSAKNNRTRYELAEIAGVTGSVIRDTKYILDHGNEEHIARAKKGGKEPDGRRNSINAIVREIKREKGVSNDDKFIDNDIPDGTKKCSFCGEILPLDMFYKGRTQCKKCHDTPAINKIGTPASKTAISAPVEDLMKDLYGTEKDMEYTSEDLLSDLESNGNMMLDNLQTIISIHKNMIENNDLKRRVSDYFEQLSEKIKKILEVEDGN